MALKDFDTNQVDVIDRHVMDYLASFRM